MAKGRRGLAFSSNERLAYRQRSAIVVAIALIVVVIVPLGLQWGQPAAWNSQFDTASKPGSSLSLATPPYDSQPAPIPGETLVRFEAPLDGALYTAIAAINRPPGQTAPLTLNEALLIGGRLPGTLLRQAAPELVALFDRFGVWAADAINPAAGIWRLKLSAAADPLVVAQAFQALAVVHYAEPNYPIYAMTREANDPFFARNQPALRRIRAPEAWDLTTGVDRVTIAVLDTGLAYGHSELRDKIVRERGRNFVAEPANDFAWDDNGHGTYVAGIAAADSNNGAGITGVAWGAKLLSVKVLDYSFQGTIATLSMGLVYVSLQPVQVVNISSGGPVRSMTLEDAVQTAYGRGLVLVAAAGNSGKQEFNYPAAFDNVIAVGASDELDRPATFSSFGQYLALVAPGANVLSLNWASDRDYATSSGTSASAPFVAGTVALMLAVNPQLSNRQVRNILQASATALAPPVTAPVSPGPLITGGPNSLVTALPTANLSPVAFSSPVAFPSVTPAALRGSTLGATYNPKQGWGRLDVYSAVQTARSGDFYPDRLTVLTGAVSGLPELQDVTISLDPGDTRYPDKNGLFRFANLPPNSYRLIVESRKYNLRASSDFQVAGLDADIITLNYDFSQDLAQALAAREPVGAFRPVTQKSTDPAIRYFPDSEHTLAGPFKEYWERQGGVRVFGLPISEEFQERGMTVQYFERAVLEYHTEYARTRFEVQARLLGVQLAQSRPELAFRRLAEAGKLYTAPASTTYFDSTGHTLGGPFKAYWETNGGLALFGFPMSEPFDVAGADGKSRRVQYFQRCRMDYFPEFNNTPYAVQLGLLGREVAQSQGLLGRQK